MKSINNLPQGSIHEVHSKFPLDVSSGSFGKQGMSLCMQIKGTNFPNKGISEKEFECGIHLSPA